MRFKTIWQHLRGRSVAGRNVIVFDDDVLLVSFPKSGNTWARFLIANLVYPNEQIGFANIERKIPGIYSNSQAAMLQMPRPRILKSHEAFDPRYKKVIYIVRDPRDTAVSSYYFDLKRRIIRDGYPIDQYVTRFIDGEFTGTAGSWGENVASWLVTRRFSNGLLLLRYEDMLEDPVRELAKIATFLGLNGGLEDLARAVRLSSADRMRKIEKQQADQWKNNRGRRQDIPFVRAATSGKWKAELPQRSVAEIELAWGNLMQFLGYELTTPAGSTPVPNAVQEPSSTATLQAR